MTPKLTNSTLYLMSISAGLVVANLYYNQPLLHEISLAFGVTESAVSNVALATQLGYALGLLFVIPLGDKVTNQKILQYDFLLMVASLVAAALSDSLWGLVFSSFLIGFSSAIPQLFVPMAAQLSEEKGRGRAIGIVMSGLLIGILGSRVISGYVGEAFGWRVMYYAAAILMVILFVLLRIKLPTIKPHFPGSYGSLLKSILYYFKTEPSLRLASLRGALAFAGLSAFWTTLVFLMEDNFGYGSTVTGLFGLLGIVGALGATVFGKLNDRLNKNRLISLASLLLIATWTLFFFSENWLSGIIIGVVLIDLALQALHITNQNIIFSKNPEGRNRVNTVYMVSFFIGGSLGTTLGAVAWQYWEWKGVSGLGLLLSGVLLVSHLFFSRKI